MLDTLNVARIGAAGALANPLMMDAPTAMAGGRSHAVRCIEALCYSGVKIK
jgi:hypothetical protein